MVVAVVGGGGLEIELPFAIWVVLHGSWRVRSLLYLTLCDTESGARRAIAHVSKNQGAQHGRGPPGRVG